MSKNPFEVSSILIGRDGNTIAAYNDGSMVFSDRFVPLVRLSDLVAGTSSNIPAQVIDVATTDWILDHTDTYNGRSFWKIYVPFTGLSTLSKVLVNCYQIIATSPEEVKQVTFDEVSVTGSSVKIVSTEKLHIYVTVKGL